MPSTGLEPYDDLRKLTEITYRIIAGNTRRAALLAVTVMEEGEPRICGRATMQARGLLPELMETLTPGPDTDGSPRALLGTVLPKGSQQIESRTLPPDETSLGGWTRAWRFDSQITARASAQSYQSVDDAITAARVTITAELGPDGIKRIDIPTLRFVSGARVLGFAWLGVQPPDSPPYVDSLLAVLGKTLVSVSVAGLSTNAGHQIASDIMQQIVRGGSTEANAG